MRQVMVLLTATVLVVTACGGSAAPAPAPAVVVTPALAPVGTAARPTSAPALGTAAAVTLRTVEGATVVVPTPGKTTVLFFMAAWCMPCVDVARMLAKVEMDYAGRGLGVVAIDVDPGDTVDELSRFRSLAGNPRYAWVLEGGQQAARRYGIRSLDATLVISGSGELLFRSESRPNESDLRRAIQRVLGP